VGSDASDGTAGLSSFFGATTSGRIELASRGCLFSTRLVASGDVRAEERSEGSAGSRQIRFPHFVCGAGPLGAGIYDGGGSDASGSGRSAGSLPTYPDVVAQRAGIFVQRPREVPASRGRHQKNTGDRTPPSEPSPRTEQIRDHRRHRSSKSALGLRRCGIKPISMPAWAEHVRSGARFPAPLACRASS